MQLAQPLTLDLDPWQIEGRDFLAMSKSAFLADEMGVGKTAQAITAFEAIGANRVLVICAAIGRIEWARRIAEWGKHGRKIQVIDTSATLPDPSADAIIIGRELTPKPKLLKALLAQDFDVCVIDECHAFKEREAKRTKAVYGPLCSSGGIVSRARRIWLLSGTPAPNNHSELWTHLRRISPERIETSRVGSAPSWFEGIQ